MPKWSESESFKFVALYKASECLWNVFHPSYKMRQKRIEACQRIAINMNIPGFTAEEVPKKIKTFRSTYYQELAKIEKSTESENLYTPSVKWFQNMDFVMRNTNTERPVEANSDAIEPNINYCYKTEPAEDEFGLDNPAIYENLQPVNPYASPTLQNRPLKRPRYSNPSSTDDQPESSKSFSAELSSETNAPVEEDECDVIGRLVAMQLRKLHPDDLVDANLEIQTVLAKYRKKHTQSVSVDSSMPLEGV